MTKSPHKTSIAEKTIQSVGRKLYQWMEISKSLRWVDYVKPLQKAYNNTHHRGLPIKPWKLTPNDIVNDPKLAMVAKKKYAKQLVEQNRQIELEQKRRRQRGVDPLRVGDSVRVINDKSIFDKSYPASFSKEIFKITRRKESNPPVFYVGSSSRPYYRQQLSKIVADESGQEADKNYFVAAVRNVKGRTLRSGLVIDKEKEFLIRARNDPEFSHWFTEQDFDALKKKVEVDEAILTPSQEE